MVIIAMAVREDPEDPATGPALDQVLELGHRHIIRVLARLRSFLRSCRCLSHRPIHD